VKEGTHFYLIVNEGEQAYEGRMQCGISGATEIWRPWEGIAEPQALSEREGGMSIPVRLNRRESIILVINPADKPVIVPQETDIADKREIHLTDWRIPPWSMPFVLPDRLECWTQTEDMEHFSGTVVYVSEFKLDLTSPLAHAMLDLGEVHEIAEVRINGQDVGVAMWAPYTFDISNTLQHGINHIAVAVTNSLANRYDRAALPSGLLGPVRIETHERRKG
jgi:hypothetical protein